jgi:hypothetical protein
MHEIISWGMGLLQAVKPTDFNPQLNYPVYIVEPAMILYLSTVFEKHPWACRKVCITNRWAQTANSSA